MRPLATGRPAPALLALACLALSGCPRSTREHRPEVPAFTFEPYAFGAPGARPLTWDFGDGSPRATGAKVEHLYARTGHVTALGFDGDFLAERFELEVEPRPVPRAVPPDARWAAWCPSLGRDFPKVVDFLEQVGSANFAASTLDESVLPGWAIELSSGDASFVDPRRGIVIFGLEHLEGQVAAMAVSDPGAAEAALSARLSERGFTAEQTADSTFFHQGQVRLLVFSDRGYLYLVAPDSYAEVPEASALQPLAQRVRSAPPAGLFAAAAFASARSQVRPGELWLWSNDPSAGALITSALVSLELRPDGASLDGRVAAGRALDHGARADLFSAAPVGAVAGLKLSLPPQELVRLLSFRPATGVPSPKETAAQRGIQLDALTRSFTGDVGLLAWFDAEAFLRNLIAGNGKPDPKGVVHLMLPLNDAKPVAQALTRWFGQPGGVAPASGATVWRQATDDSVLTAALTEGLLSVRLGDPQPSRANADLQQALNGRLEGAFSPGHSSLFVDLGQLKRELEQPRTIEGIDPQRLVMAQGLSSAFLSRVAVDFAAVDFAPDGKGGVLKGMLTLRPRK